MFQIKERGSLRKREVARILFSHSSGQRRGLGAGPNFISNPGDREKHLNWTSEVAFQPVGIRSGLVLNLLQLQLREGVLVRVFRLFHLHLARGLLSQGLSGPQDILPPEP